MNTIEAMRMIYDYAKEMSEQDNDAPEDIEEALELLEKLVQEWEAL